MGAGLIGRQHIARIASCRQAELAAIIDPDPASCGIAEAHGVAWHGSLAAMLAVDRPEGVVIATPNQLHVPHGLACAAAGLPALIEKPLADDVQDAARLVAAFEQGGLALLTGHHRRHNPLVRAARAQIEQGVLGRIVAVQATCWFCKPDRYFEPSWRREAGAGPVLLNLIHDVDLMRHLCGEIVSVQAARSSAVRNLAVEDSAVILLRFASGALGTMSVSDCVVSPWSWEFTAGENPAYTHTGESTYLIGGTLGALSVPQLDVWRHTTQPDWWEPIASERIPVERDDPLGRQIENFCAVIRGTEQPVVSGLEGLRTLRVMSAIHEAAGREAVVRLD